MPKNTLLWLLLVLFALSVSLSGCGGSTLATPTPPAITGSNFIAIDSAATSISSFNGQNIYVMLTAQPASKPEANNTSSVTTYPFTLNTTDITSATLLDLNQNGDGFGNNSGNSTAQTRVDLLLRQTENQMLASRARQVANSRSALMAPITVGTSWNHVNILNSNSQWATIDTTCRKISNKAYFFVDNRDTANMSSYLDDYAAAFDTIYDTDIAHFGTPRDVDNNGKVIIVFSEELTGGLLGYFYSIDKYANNPQNPHSNEGDIFYITTDALPQGDTVKGTLAHELQHMIYFDQHYNNGVTNTYTWLNEALSQAAEYYNGYVSNHLAWIADFLRNWDGLSLTHWTSNNYGYGAIFIRYLIDQYGDVAIKNMCATGNVGIHAVEAATGTDFNTIFNNFTFALVMSGTGESADSRCNFRTLDIRALQSAGRGGLLPAATSYNAGGTFSSAGIYPYRLVFTKWLGNFGTVRLSGNSMAGTTFGLHH